jgi:ornithine decarboxylase
MISIVILLAVFLAVFSESGSVVVATGTAITGSYCFDAAWSARKTKGLSGRSGWSAWKKRFGWAEITGSAAAAVGFFVCYLPTASLKAAAFSATAAEFVGFYGFIGLRAVRLANQANRHHPRGLRRAAAIAWHAVMEELGCFVAELADSLYFRPGFILLLTVWLEHRLPGGIIWGFVFGKLLSDLIYYRIEKVVRLYVQQIRDHLNRPRTPCLWMDLAVVRAKFLELQHAFPAGARLHYAVKCNPRPKVLAALRDAGCSFEIASVAEWKKLHRLKVPPEKVIYSNPIRTWQDVEATFNAGIKTFAADSCDQLRVLAEHAPGSNVFLRLVTAGGGAVASEGSGGNPPKFGVNRRKIVRLVQFAQTHGLVPGLTFHVGSQTNDPKAWVAPLMECGELMQELLPLRIHAINLGGGFPAEYDTKPLPFSEFGTAIADALIGMPYRVQLVAEPGRALVAEAGVMEVEVVDVATREGKLRVCVNASPFHGIIEALESGCELAFPMEVVGGGSRPIVLCDVYGNTCDSQDALRFGVNLHEPRVGDHLLIRSIGAYSSGYLPESKPWRRLKGFHGLPVPAVHFTSN